MVGGLLHALATVTFNVDHIVSGVAINLLAVGISRYLSAQVFVGEAGGGLTKSPPQKSAIGTVDIPFLSGGEIFGWRSPDILGWFERTGWPVISDVAGIVGGVTRQVSLATLLSLGLLAVSGWVLWRTRFGLRVRSCGEAPYAADSLGVSVERSRYSALAISGGIAGLGGACLSVVSASAYAENQTGGRGFVGLATMIFGNWRPTGLLGGSMLFGYAEAVRLRDEREVTALLLVGAVLMVAAAIWQRENPRRAGLFLTVSAVTFAVWAMIEKVPRQLTTITPFVATLIVLAVASQRLRPPAAAGVPYRRGEAH
jgi:simple sugar transport system permease protein